MVVELSPDYYLKNFNTMLEFVVKQYPDLIAENEWAFIKSYQKLSDDAAKLFVRLCLRQKSIYFSEQLEYREITSMNEALMELNESDFILINPLIEKEDLLQALTKVDLKYLFSNKKISHHLPKPQVVESILAAYSSDVIYELVFAAKTLIFKNKEKEVEALLHFFFGNRHQSLTEFVLQDLGRVKYEPYIIDQNSRLFQNRLDFEHSLLLGQLSEESFLAVEADDLEEVMAVIPKIPNISSNRKLISQKGKVLNRCAAFLEKKIFLTEALNLYQQTDRVPSRERQARILNALNQPENALAICEQILKNSISEDEKEFAENFSLKLNSVKIKKVKTEPIAKEKYFLEKLPDKSVEQIALEFFSPQYHKVCFVENALMNSLFGLWFWEEIFVAIPGAFCHPFQLGPQDLFTDDFIQARQEILFKKLSQLKAEPNTIQKQFLETYQVKKRISNFFVDWDIVNIDVLQLAVKCIPPQHLFVIFERLLFGLKENGSGFPDLIAFTKDQLSYEMIEIKGPGDKLQKNQTRWFHYFMKYHIPCKLVHIEWKTT